MAASGRMERVGGRISRRIAVIGGGCAGLTAARYLLRAGHHPVVFESGADLGGVWAKAPTNAVVYQNLQTNLPTCVMQSPSLDFPPGLPSYVTARDLGRYIEEYANHFGISQLVLRNAHVTAVAPVRDNGSNNDEQWRVSWSNDSGGWREELFDAITVATGHYNKPHRPEIPGQVKWLGADAARRIFHSIDYNSPEELRGRSVMVVGGRSSAVDIARELKGVAKWTYVLDKGCCATVAHSNEAEANSLCFCRLWTPLRGSAPRQNGWPTRYGTSRRCFNHPWPASKRPGSA